PSSGLYAFQPDVVVLAVHAGEATLPELAADPEPAVAAEVQRWTSLWELIQVRTGAQVVQHLFAVPPEVALGHLAATLPGARSTMLAAVNAGLGEQATDGVAVVDCDRLAAEVGNEIARRGHGLVSGGGSVSCMGAVARATRDGGGYTVGVIPQALLDLEVSDPDADELIVTETMRERKGIMDARSDAFLTLPGGLGTLEELLEIWTARVLGMHDKPVVVLDPDGVFAHLRKQVDEMTERGFVRPAAHDALRWTSTIAEAFDELEKAVATADQLEPTAR
nr:TIGR00730 family Rossman fold protein [Micromonospora sp. DSM 115978]